MSFMVAVVRYTSSAEGGKADGAVGAAASVGPAAKTARTAQAAEALRRLANDMRILGRAGLRACVLDDYDKIVWHI